MNNFINKCLENGIQDPYQISRLYMKKLALDKSLWDQISSTLKPHYESLASALGKGQEGYNRANALIGSGLGYLGGSLAGMEQPLWAAAAGGAGGYFLGNSLEKSLEKPLGDESLSLNNITETHKNYEELKGKYVDKAYEVYEKLPGVRTLPDKELFRKIFTKTPQLWEMSGIDRGTLEKLNKIEGKFNDFYSKHKNLSQDTMNLKQYTFNPYDFDTITEYKDLHNKLNSMYGGGT